MLVLTYPACMWAYWWRKWKFYRIINNSFCSRELASGRMIRPLRAVRKIICAVTCDCLIKGGAAIGSDFLYWCRKERTYMVRKTAKLRGLVPMTERTRSSNTVIWFIFYKWQKRRWCELRVFRGLTFRSLEM